MIQTVLKDVNYDGIPDLLVGIVDADGAVNEGSDIATVTGNLADGTPIEGVAAICFVP